MRYRFWLLLAPLLAIGITTAAWSQDGDESGKHAGKCDPAKGHCVSTIVFSSTRDHMDLLPNPALNFMEIYRLSMNGDGTPNMDTLVRLTETERIACTDPTFVSCVFGGNFFPKLSPDGKRIVFDSFRDRAPGEPRLTSSLFLMKSDGSDQRPLTRGNAATWSPDGKYIAFHASASGAVCPVSTPPPFPGIPGCSTAVALGASTWDSDIFIMRVPDDDEGIEAPINLTNTPSHIEDDADWSPDGKKIVFVRRAVTAGFPEAEICVLTLETSAVECLALNNEERAPTWSPDGGRIAYMCRNPTNNAFEICVVNVDGTGRMQLTNDAVVDATPGWSPDGEKIVWGKGMTGVAVLWLVNPDGTGLTRLDIPPVTPGTSTGANLAPSWGWLWVGGKSHDQNAGGR